MNVHPTWASQNEVLREFRVAAPPEKEALRGKVSYKAPPPAVPTNRKLPCIPAVSSFALARPSLLLSFLPEATCFLFPVFLLVPELARTDLHPAARPMTFSVLLRQLELRLLCFCFLDGPRVGLTSTAYSGWCSITMALRVFQRASCVWTPVIQP